MEKEKMSFKEVANWQLKADGKVLFPNVDTYFKTDPWQLEFIWNCILEGGCSFDTFTLAPYTDGNTALLEGEESATAIALGYFNPWEKKHPNAFGKQEIDKLPVLWIDLLPSRDYAKPLTYLVRVLTEHHPFGYQTFPKGKPITEEEKQSALEQLNIENVNDLKNTDIFPYHGNFSVPLTFLLDYIEHPVDNAVFLDRLFNCTAIPRERRKTYEELFYRHWHSFENWCKNIRSSINQPCFVNILKREDVICKEKA